MEDTVEAVMGESGAESHGETVNMMSAVDEEGVHLRGGNGLKKRKLAQQEVSKRWKHPTELKEGRTTTDYGGNNSNIRPTIPEAMEQVSEASKGRHRQKHVENLVRKARGTDHKLKNLRSEGGNPKAITKKEKNLVYQVKVLRRFVSTWEITDVDLSEFSHVPYPDEGDIDLSDPKNRLERLKLRESEPGEKVEEDITGAPDVAVEEAIIIDDDTPKKIKKEKKDRKSSKRQHSSGNFEPDQKVEEDTADAADASAEEAMIIGDETPKKIKKEKRDKKKRKRQHSSRNSSPDLESVPDFQVHASEQPEDTLDNTHSRIVLSPETGRHNRPVYPDPPSPEQLKQSALMDTITRARTRSESTGDTRIYEVLVANMLAQPTPPSPMSPADNPYSSLIDIGRSAIAAPILPNSQKPIRDRAFKTQAPEALKKNLVPPPHKESPILPPQRSFSSTKIVPISKEVPSEKTKGERKNKNKKKDPHKEKGDKASSTAPQDSPESTSLSQAVTALQERASSSAMRGLFSQPDSLPRSKRIIPPVKVSVPRASNFPNNINSSTPDSTPTKATKAKHRRSRTIEGEAEDWELSSGRVRARVVKEGTNDDGETEENIAFSSKYLQDRPLGISIGGTKFQVLNIFSGTEQELPISTDKEGIKVCSVAKGRVKVTLGSRSFSIEEGGMWRVRGGEECIVANQLSSQLTAAVHICTIEE